MNPNEDKVAEGSRESPDFSVVLGGPIFQLLRRSRLAGDELELLFVRIAVISLLAWAPLLILAIIDGKAWGGPVKVPFLMDLDVHVKFLVALPLMIAAELVVHSRMRVVVRQFTERGLVSERSRAGFDAAIASGLRLRNSIPAELLLIVFVYAVGVFYVWRYHTALAATTWYGAPSGGRPQPSLAGWWYGFVSLPMMQFVLLRWYYRLFIWARFLWQVSRLDLNLIPTHPDRAGGLGFLANVIHAFAPLLLAQGALLSGLVGGHILFDGATLPQFKVEIVLLVAAMVLAVLGPLVLFAPALERCRRAGLTEYGALAQRYVRDFDRKWLRGGAPPDEPFLGAADIQSLADMGNSFGVIQEMKLTPFGIRTVIQLAIVTLLPVLPLTLTMIPFEELVSRLVKMVF